MTNILRIGLDAGSDSADIAKELDIKAIAVDGLELLAMSEHSIDELASEDSVDVCQIGMFGYNPLSSDSEAQKKQAEALIKVIPLAAKIGCSFIAIGSGNYHPSGFGDFDRRNMSQDALQIFASALIPMLDIADRHQITLCIEPYLKNAIHSAERFTQLHKLAGSSAYLKANIDLTSLMDFSSYVSSDVLNDSITTEFSDHYGLVHVKDIGLKEGFHINLQLAPVGTSNVDWGRYLKNVSAHLPQDSYVILEHIANLEEAKNTLSLIRSAASAHQIELI